MMPSSTKFSRPRLFIQKVLDFPHNIAADQSRLFRAAVLGWCDSLHPGRRHGLLEAVIGRRGGNSPSRRDGPTGVTDLRGVTGLHAKYGSREGLPVLSRRRWKPSVGRMPKDGFQRASGRQDAESERPARWHGQPRPTEGAASNWPAGIVRHGVTDLRAPAPGTLPASGGVEPRSGPSLRRTSRGALAGAGSRPQTLPRRLT